MDEPVIWSVYVSSSDSDEPNCRGPFEQCERYIADNGLIVDHCLWNLKEIHAYYR